MGKVPKIRYVDIIYPPPPNHIPGTIPRRWVTRDELAQMRGEEEVSNYVNLLGRISYWECGLRLNKHFVNAYNITRKFLD
jgi:hypothetical protein